MPNEPLKLCPLCDLLHGHEIHLDIQEERPQVRCPCAKCRVENRVWDTHEEYEHWVEKNLPTIMAYAEEERARVAEGIPEPDIEHEHFVEELVDRRKYDIRQKKESGEWQPQSAWGKSGPPD